MNREKFNILVSDTVRDLKLAADQNQEFRQNAEEMYKTNASITEEEKQVRFDQLRQFHAFEKRLREMAQVWEWLANNQYVAYRGPDPDEVLHQQAAERATSRIVPYRRHLKKV